MRPLSSFVFGLCMLALAAHGISASTVLRCHTPSRYPNFDGHFNVFCDVKTNGQDVLHGTVSIRHGSQVWGSTSARSLSFVDPSLPYSFVVAIDARALKLSTGSYEVTAFFEPAADKHQRIVDTETATFYGPFTFDFDEGSFAVDGQEVHAIKPQEAPLKLVQRDRAPAGNGCVASSVTYSINAYNFSNQIGAYFQCENIHLGGASFGLQWQDTLDPTQDKVTSVTFNYRRGVTCNPGFRTPTSNHLDMFLNRVPFGAKLQGTVTSCNCDFARNNNPAAPLYTASVAISPSDYFVGDRNTISIVNRAGFFLAFQEYVDVVVEYERCPAVAPSDLPACRQQDANADSATRSITYAFNVTDRQIWYTVLPSQPIITPSCFRALPYFTSFFGYSWNDALPSDAVILGLKVRYLQGLNCNAAPQDIAWSITSSFPASNNIIDANFELFAPQALPVEPWECVCDPSGEKLDQQVTREVVVSRDDLCFLDYAPGKRNIFAVHIASGLQFQSLEIAVNYRLPASATFDCDNPDPTVLSTSCTTASARTQEKAISLSFSESSSSNACSL